MACPVIVNSPVADTVNSNMGRLWDWAQDAWDTAEAAIEAAALAGLGDATEVPTYTPVDINGMDTPGSPNPAPTVTFTTPDAIYDPTIDDINFKTIDPPPEFDGEAPLLVFPGTPDDFEGTYPDDPPTIVDKEMPDEPGPFTWPTYPDFYTITIPTIPDIDIPEWTETAPTQDIEAPSQGLEYTEEAYTSDLLDEVTSEILRMLEGGTGLPDYLWQAIIDAAATRVGEAAYRSLMEAREEWAAKGWSLPSGILDKRIREIRQNTYNQENEFIRNTQIEQAKMEIENLQFAVAQGISLENLSQTLFNNIQNRSLQAAIAKVDTAVKIMEAKIALYNAELTGYKIAADVHKTLIEANMVEVELYKAQIQAANVLGQMNKTLVDVYVAQFQAIQKEIDIYNSQLASVKLQYDIDVAKITVFSEQVKAFTAEVNAWKAEWEGYTAAVEGQVGRVNAYKAEVDAYKALVDSYGTEVDAESNRTSAEIEIEKLDIEEMKADTQRFIAEVQAEAARIGADVSAYKAYVDAYGASSSFFASKTQAWEAEMKANIAQAQAVAEVALAGAQIASNELIQNAQLVESARDSAAKASTAVTQSALSGINIQAGISGQDSTNSNYNYSC